VGQSGESAWLMALFETALSVGMRWVGHGKLRRIFILVVIAEVRYHDGASSLSMFFFAFYLIKSWLSFSLWRLPMCLTICELVEPQLQCRAGYAPAAAQHSFYPWYWWQRWAYLGARPKTRRKSSMLQPPQVLPTMATPVFRPTFCDFARTHYRPTSGNGLISLPDLQDPHISNVEAAYVRAARCRDGTTKQPWKHHTFEER
jgi:hypothetical protein